MSCLRSLSFKSCRCPPCLNKSVQWESWIIHGNIRPVFVCIHFSLSFYFYHLSPVPGPALLPSFPPFCFLWLWRRNIRISYFIAFFSLWTHGICLTSWKAVISWPSSSDSKENEKQWPRTQRPGSYEQILCHAGCDKVTEGSPCLIYHLPILHPRVLLF